MNIELRAAEMASDGCDPARWRDEWLIKSRPGGDVPVIGAVARTIEERLSTRLVKNPTPRPAPAESPVSSSRRGMYPFDGNSRAIR